MIHNLDKKTQRKVVVPAKFIEMNPDIVTRVLTRYFNQRIESVYF